MTWLSERRRAEQLLELIRTRVAELDGLDQTLVDRRELRQRRREIAELQWRLARFISKGAAGGDLAA